MSQSTVISTPSERTVNALKEVASEGATVVLSGVAATATVPLSSVTFYGATTSLAMTTGPKLIGTVAMGNGAYAGSGLVAKAITGAGFASEAKLVTGAAIASSSTSSLGIVGTIELLSLKVGIFFGMAPTL